MPSDEVEWVDGISRAAVAPGCEACLSGDVRHHRVSRGSGSVVYECRRCGLHALSERPTQADLTDYVVGLDEEHYAEWVGEPRTSTVEAEHADVLERLSGYGRPGERPRLFDVGAGTGAFLARARDAGFIPAGNDLSPGAISLARETHGLELVMGDLADLDDQQAHDVVTLWCVLAHVPDGAALMRDVFRLLRPGGTMYLVTPRWSGLDALAMAAHDLTRGRASRILDRRLAMHHMVLHTNDSMRALLERLGFEIVSIEPRVRFSLTTACYLESLEVPERWRHRLARPIDALLARDACFRNVLEVYARKPER